MGDSAKKYFKCSVKERAAFELGIKFGALYHQYMGIPVDFGNVDVLERAMEESIRVQPHVTDVKVTIDRSGLRKDRKDTYGYTTLNESNLSADITVIIEGTEVKGSMRYVEDLGYPLMYITSVKEIN